MTFTQSMAAELPFLRRYARAITGSQALGDAAVRTMLESILEAPDEIDQHVPTRVELYRIFHRLWRPIGDESPSRAPTATLAPRVRQALMLNTIEGFSQPEIAEILDETIQVVNEDLELARQSITEQLISDVMIIEDEAIIALHIKTIVAGMGHNVLGIARTHGEAVKLALDTSPELVLADISLADGSSGVDAVRDILNEIDVPVIFVTSFPERLLTGERLEPTYLLTKPFDPPVLAATISQALMLHRETVGMSHSIAA
jgi:CheY-like chemotaxis protein